MIHLFYKFFNRKRKKPKIKLGYDHIWIVVDEDNFVRAACWSETYRDSHIRLNPDHVVIRYDKSDCLGKDQ